MTDWSLISVDVVDRILHREEILGEKLARGPSPYLSPNNVCRIPDIVIYKLQYGLATYLPVAISHLSPPHTGGGYDSFVRLAACAIKNHDHCRLGAPSLQ
jgi:hypothetical protein